jgi:CelD/BcsL family acetyltransferase involved in cellulose biosynthesis
LNDCPVQVMRVADAVLLDDEWRCLLSHNPAHTFFLTPEWQSLWWQILGVPANDLPHTVVIRDYDGTLIGLAPLMRPDSDLTSLHFAGGEEIADFLDMFALPGRESEVAARVCDALADEAWSEIDLRNLRADSLALAHFAPEAERRGCRILVEQEDVSPWLSLPATWDAYLETLSKKDRHELRRKLRRLQSTGEVRCFVASDPETRTRDVAEFVRLMRLSAEAKSAFLTPEMTGWFDAIVDRFAPTGQLLLYFLELDGVRIATTICFVHANRNLLYNSGYDPEYGRLSAGLALKAYCIEDAIASGREVFDFLQGSEPYKYDLGAVDAPIYRLRIFRS